MYTKVSIPKNGDGAGCAIIKDPNIILVDVNDIVSEPTRSHGNVNMEGDLELAEGAKSIAIYATSSSIVCGSDQEGEEDANYFQHVPYLDDFNAQNGTEIVSVGAIHVESMGIYGGKQASLDAIQ